MYLTITEAAKKAKISRATLYILNKEGKISFHKTPLGKNMVDVAELSRLYDLDLTQFKNDNASKNTPDAPIVSNHEKEILEIKLQSAEDKITFLEKHIKALDDNLIQEKERVTSLLKTTEKLLITQEKKPEGIITKLKKVFR